LKAFLTLLTWIDIENQISPDFGNVQEIVIHISDNICQSTVLFSFFFLFGGKRALKKEKKKKVVAKNAVKIDFFFKRTDIIILN
jgi:hypothetical protein